MFAGSCHDWRLQLVLQCRFQVTRIQGNVGVMSPMQPKWIFYSLRKCTFIYLINLQMIYDFITEPTICWQYVLDVLSSFNYVEVSMMFMRNDVWLESVIWIDLKSLIAFCCWDLNYANVDWWIEVVNCLWIYIESMS